MGRVIEICTVLRKHGSGKDNQAFCQSFSVMTPRGKNGNELKEQDVDGAMTNSREVEEKKKSKHYK